MLLFFFLLYSIIFLLFQLLKKKINVKHALAIPTGAPISLVNEIIDTPPAVALKQLTFYVYNQKF